MSTPTWKASWARRPANHCAWDRSFTIRGNTKPSNWKVTNTWGANMSDLRTGWRWHTAKWLHDTLCWCGFHVWSFNNDEERKRECGYCHKVQHLAQIITNWRLRWEDQ